MDEARRSQTDLCIAWLDLQNAFGSIPHAALIASLENSRVGSHFTDIVNDMYTGCTSTVMTSNDTTGPIPVRAGIRQGCPLSGILFNIAMDPLLRTNENDAEAAQHDTLAFADDLCVLAPNPHELQQRLENTSRLAERMGLHFNTDKCCTMHFSGATPTGCRETEFTINGRTIPHLRTTETTTFLGKPVGYNILSDWESLQSHMTTAQRLMTSSLAPWQRLDALKTFFFPSLQFSLRTGILTKTDWKKLDAFIRPMIKTTLNLPPRASNDSIYGARTQGCLGIPLVAEDCDIVTVDGAFKLLTSPDPVTRSLAARHLSTTIGDRIGHHPSPDEEAEYLSASQEGVFAVTTNRQSNIWTRTRIASRHLSCQWQLTPEPRIKRNETTLHSRQRHMICNTIRTQLRNAKTAALHELPHQGKVHEVVALNTASSHFMTTGLYIRFADWRFIHRARLGLVPLNLYRFNEGTRNCRRCNNEEESLPHVINHCPTHNSAILKRHNAIVNRIKAATETKFRLISENRTVIEGSLIRPDLLLAHKKTAYIIDVTIPFENRAQAFEEARNRKLTHYTDLRQDLLATYDKVEIIPFIIGSLGSWDPANDKFVSIMSSRTYARTFRKLCVTDVIRWSRDIYTEHLTGVRQY